MDTTWTNMRQVVADRVLNRHLRDLEDCDQHVAMGMTPKQHLRLAQRRGSGEPPPKLHAFPARPPSNTNHNGGKHHIPVPPPGSGEEPLGNHPPLPPQPPPEERPPSRDGARILDMMAETLQSASLMEQKRPSLYLNGAELNPGTAAGSFKAAHGGPKSDTTLPRPSKSAHKKGSKFPPEIRGPSLEKGEKFVKTNKYQMLSIDASVEDLAASLGNGQFPRPTTSTTKATKSRRSSFSSQHDLHEPKIPQPRRRSVHVAMPEQEGTPQAHPHRRRSVHVEFYDEIDTGLRKEQGGFTPHHLTLPLHLLHDGSSDDNNDNTDGGEGEGAGSEEGKVTENDEEREKDAEGWDDVKKCHYIRGYDPPHMRMPTDSVKFVFGEKTDAPDQPR